MISLVWNKHSAIKIEKYLKIAKKGGKSIAKYDPLWVRKKNQSFKKYIFFRYEDFATVTLKHAAADSYTVVGLQEFVDYELFVQPFNEAGIVGLPTALKLVKTHQTRPSNSPVILEAKMFNATMLMVSWNPLHEDDHNGPLLGFKVSVYTYFFFLEK